MDMYDNEYQQYQKSTNKKRKTILLATFFFYVLLTFLSAFVSYTFVTSRPDFMASNADLLPSVETGMSVEIPFGSGTATVAQVLYENGLIKFPLVFKILSKINGYDGTYKSGVHVLNESLSYDEMMRVLASNPKSIRITIPEGYSYSQIMQELENKKLVNKQAFAETASGEKFDYKFLSGLPSRKNKFEGYLFPDTYEFDIKVTPREIIDQMLRNFDGKFSADYYKKAKTLGMTVDDIIILASIVEKEAKIPEERSLIAGVFYNRLKNKSKPLRKLQSCATIQYIYLNSTGKIKDKISINDTKIDDKYNTYVYEGLPPGPICSPGIASIEAVLNPQRTSYLYFVAKGDGSHVFSNTLEEHNAQINKYEGN